MTFDLYGNVTGVCFQSTFAAALLVVLPIWCLVPWMMLLMVHRTQLYQPWRLDRCITFIQSRSRVEHLHVNTSCIDLLSAYYPHMHGTSGGSQDSA